MTESTSDKSGKVTPEHAREVAASIHRAQVTQIRDSAAEIVERKYGEKLPVRDSYDEIFETEMNGWCYGIENYPGAIYPALLHRVIRELSVSLRTAINHNVVFDIPALAYNVSRAAKFLVPEKDIAYSILSQLPFPWELGEDGMYVLGAVVDRMEQAHPGSYARLQRKWQMNKKAA